MTNVQKMLVIIFELFTLTDFGTDAVAFLLMG